MCNNTNEKWDLSKV